MTSSTNTSTTPTTSTRSTRSDRINRVGEQYGALTVIAYVGMRSKKPTWLCLCSLCGGTREVAIRNLTSGAQRTCGRPGCKREARKMDGYSADPHRVVWRNMMARCYRPEHPAYHSYGGRGITVHPAWHDYDTWRAATPDRPSDDHSYDRLNVDRGYAPGNVRWATPQEQAANRRNTRYTVVEGRRMAYVDAYREYAIEGLNTHTVASRIYLHGWEPMRALTTPRYGARRA